MSATGVPANPSPGTVQQLLQKMTDADPDFRFMSLNDLFQVLTIAKPDFLHHEYNVGARTVDALIKALDDQNGEVQNLAVKCLGPLVGKVHSSIVAPMLDKLASLKLKNTVDNSLPSVALRTVIIALPRPVPGAVPTLGVQTAYDAISRVVIPRLVAPGRQNQLLTEQPKLKLPQAPGYMLDGDTNMSTEAVDVMIEVARCFGPLLKTTEAEAMLESLLGILEAEKGSSVMRKRAVTAVSTMAVYISDDGLQTLVGHMAASLQNPKISPLTRRLYISVMGSMARHIPRRFGQNLTQLAPFILGALSQEELDTQLAKIDEGDDASPEFNEVHEAALITLEAFLSSCPQEMAQYTDEAMDAALRFLKYDPNYAVDEDDEDEEMESDEDEEEDDEDELDDGFDDDDDDSSWKVRRSAAKALYTLVSTRGSGDLLENGVLYQKAGPLLVKRFEEREENVRLEVLSVLSLLVRKTGEGTITQASSEDLEPEIHSALPTNRKRRRQSSVGGAAGSTLLASIAGIGSPIQEKAPPEGPHADLARLSPSIVKASVKLLKGKLVPTKQAVINLLDDIVNSQRGGLGEFFPGIWGPVMACLQSSAGGGSSSLALSGGNASATPTTLRLATLRLISDISKTHSSSTLHPYLSNIVTGVIRAVDDKFYKISSEAIRTAEELVKTITPPRSRHTAQKFKGELQKLFDVLMERANASNVDAEVRQRAIHGLGTLLSRTSSADGASLISDSARKEALAVLLARVKNETTRLAACRAIDSVAAFNTSSATFDAAWTQEVVQELSSHLRKANRSLRGASIQALKHLVVAPACKGQLDTATVQNLVASLLPVIDANDAYLMGPALAILGVVAEEQPELVLKPELTKVICKFIKDGSPTIVIEPLLFFVTEVGKSGNGKDLMRGLLQNVGVQGDPTVLGQVIGTLLVSGGDTTGVSLQDFTKELETGAKNRDDNRVSLALAVLGEAGMRLGPESTLPPRLFLEQFRDEPDKVSRAAAVALGRAGSTNVGKYLPVILPLMSQAGNTQYLLVQSIKEITQQLSTLSGEIEPYVDTIWDRILEASAQADNRVACSECIGRLVILDQGRFTPRLQALLKDRSPSLRAMAVQALRYTLPDGDEAFDGILRNVLVDMLYTMLQDEDMEIRRLAMTTLNSAAHNKPDMILPHIGSLMPFVLSESVIKPELIREVMMGPFKHKVDDGLEVRKSAYETLYALMETVFPRINTISFHDRVVAGLRDENDIRALCNLMVAKLAVIDREETLRRLDSIAEAYRAVLSTKLKDTAVKQEVEKHAESTKSVLRVTVLLQEKVGGGVAGAGGAPAAATAGVAGQDKVSAGVGAGWVAYWEWVVKDFGPQLKALKEEGKEVRR
ncbi:related to TBP (TATA-binding protein) -interacting protein TIP120 [Cephalotrichum gorgonifer]|uniref:Related to TBP (TATA-binding protein) -interacting protein TIP120 n=1 Tax=Cephalotrichum gorgonifer TaxID=2041049 RepID=A0AAE8T0C2_9PEZI|nr:related to TBP (TATA-binding protein) -interacting protein TIP120 [Cephalotrichum gorgonifer]